MALLGQMPTQDPHDVIVTDGTSYVESTLVRWDENSLQIKSTGVFRRGGIRVFPLHPEKDGLYEIHANFVALKDGMLLLRY